MGPIELLKHFEGRTAQICADIEAIVDIESPSNDAGQSSALIDHIVERVMSIPDTSFERRESAAGEHLIIDAFAGPDQPIMLLGHTDTVHPIGTAVKNPTRVSDGRLFGCGVFDMKANIIVALEALSMLASGPVRAKRPIKFVLTCDEEVGSKTGRQIVESCAANAAFCLVPEPSAHGKAKTGRKGTGNFKLTSKGLAAHAGLEPEKGANALTELAAQIPSIHSIARPDVGTTVNVTTMNSGGATNVIPDLAVCDIDVRFTNAEEGERVQGELRELCAGDARVTLDLSGDINRPPLERTEAIIELFERARSIAHSFGYDIEETQVGGASDGNFVAAIGVPVLDGLGVTGDGAHTLDEYILVNDIAPRATLLTLLLADL